MTDTRQTDALAALYAALYAALSTAKAKGPQTVRDLSPDARTAYDREAKRRQRERARVAKADGMPEATDAATPAPKPISTTAPPSRSTRGQTARSSG